MRRKVALIVTISRSHRTHFAMLWLAIGSHTLHGLIDAELTWGGALGLIVAATQVYGHVYELLAHDLEH